MPRILSRQNAGKSFVNSLTLHEGGTGKNTPTDALDALYGIPSGLKGGPLGPVELDGAGRLNLSALEGISLTDTGIDGDSTIQLRETKEYFLTTYDSYQTYEVEGVLGTARIERNVIYYTAGEMPGIGGFIINGRRINVLVQGIAMLKPSITVPINNAVDRPLFMTFIGSSFQTLGGSDTHVSSDWELATDINFVDVVQRSQDDSVNLTSWAVTDMQELKKHYVRVRYKGQNAGLSPWSNAVGFTTGNDGLINTETGKIIPSPQIAGEWFGTGVGLSGDGNVALIGATRSALKGFNSGSVYYFKKENSQWVQKQKFTALDTDENDFIGSASIALNNDGTRAIIGAPTATTEFGDRGAVYYFKRINDIWVEQAKIYPSGTNYSLYGLSAAMNAEGTFAVIGSTDGSESYNGGSVFLYNLIDEKWVFQQRIYSPEPTKNNRFGVDVALNSDGSQLLISAIRYPGDNSNKGAVYYYKKVSNVWTMVQLFTSLDVLQNDLFGQGLSISGDGNLAIISAYRGVNSQGVMTGKSYVFSKIDDSWVQDRVLYPSDGSHSDFFGISSAIRADGRCALIGAGMRSENGIVNSGCIYIFE